MEIIILIIVCLVCLALGFFITKVILGKDLTTFQLKVENYEKILCTRQISQNPYPIRLLLS